MFLFCSIKISRIFVKEITTKTKEIMTTEKINKIRSEYIVENMNNGLSFELALEKSFNQINEFLNSLMNNEDFNELVFKNVLNNF